MSAIVNIPDALHKRMRLLAQAMAERVSDPGAWAGYTADEPLLRRLTKPPELGYALTVDYMRDGIPDAKMSLGFLDMVDIKEIERGPATVIEDDIEERESFTVKFKHAIEYTENFEHEFSRTTSFSEAAKQAWEVAAKASLSVEYAGIKGALEVSGKYGQEYQQQHQESETTRDKISRTLSFTGPAEFTLEAYRSHNREKRVVKAQCDFDGKVYWVTGSSAWEFTTFFTQFMPVAKRIAADDIYGYDEFMRKPLSDDEIAALEVPSDKIVEFVVEYDNIVASRSKKSSVFEQDFHVIFTIVTGGLVVATIIGMVASYVQSQRDRVRIDHLESKLAEVSVRLEKEIDDNHSGLKQWFGVLDEKIDKLTVTFARWEGKQSAKYTDE